MADYYKILGVDKNASSSEIKQAFRRLAQKYHPDKAGGDAQKFKEVNAAYQALSDPEKRKMYNQYGSKFEQAQAQGGFKGFDFNDFASYADAMRGSGSSGFSFDESGFGGLGDMFEDLFGRGAGFGRGMNFVNQGRDIQIRLAIDFREAIFGAEKELRFERYVKCPKCGGTCLEPGSKMTICRFCQGKGEIIKTQSTFLGSIRTRSVCPECHGHGKVPEKKCRYCRGQGRVKEFSKIKIKIPAGVADGQTIRFRGYGEAGKLGGQQGDLYVIVAIRPDPFFKRQGNDIFTEQEISISQAVLGDKVKVETLYGGVNLKIPPGTHSGQEFRLKGKGVAKKGNQIVKIKIKIPKHLTSRQKNLLEKLSQEGL
ncbi:molecular chaperone DnaJ [Candidatus Parcubacteria bacterium 4484_255]|nr:MAG: molecular chaperone DnaJ [Candidatus Parcubacteria bacterium 4484_255]